MGGSRWRWGDEERGEGREERGEEEDRGERREKREDGREERGKDIGKLGEREMGDWEEGREWTEWGEGGRGRGGERTEGEKREEKGKRGGGTKRQNDPQTFREATIASCLNHVHPGDSLRRTSGAVFQGGSPLPPVHLLHPRRHREHVIEPPLCTLPLPSFHPCCSLAHTHTHTPLIDATRLLPDPGRLLSTSAACPSTTTASPSPTLLRPAGGTPPGARPFTLGSRSSTGPRVGACPPYARSPAHFAHPTERSAALRRSSQTSVVPTLPRCPANSHALTSPLFRPTLQATTPCSLPPSFPSPSWAEPTCTRCPSPSAVPSCTGTLSGPRYGQSLSR